jgi:coenzyme PQQ synthesis protein D (PqqD)
MNKSLRYVINAPDVVSEDFNGEVVILNLANGHYFSLRGIASSIWAAILAGNAPESILASIAQQRPELLDASSTLLSRLMELGLMRPGTGENGTEPLEDQAWSGESPQIEVFDDLAELIFADPIHDVDEQLGWPAPLRQV